MTREIKDRYTRVIESLRGISFAPLNIEVYYPNLSEEDRLLPSWAERDIVVFGFHITAHGQGYPFAA
jgi:hypothetical protein